ncbi:MAG: sugar phosphate isomerase/epimerase family protein [Planctomycetota bacterium]
MFITIDNRQSTIYNAHGPGLYIVLMGYNTNGFTHHTLRDAVAILNEIGYRSIALTLERDLLEPPDRGGAARAIERIEPWMAAANLRVTIETGARFILDPRRKHQPTLVSKLPEDRARRIEFIKAAVDVAAAVAADSVSLWSGSADDHPNDGELYDRLTASLRAVLTHAETAGVRLSLEPEPGMFIDTMTRFEELHSRVNHPLLGLTLDVGHVHCLTDGNLRDHVRRWHDGLWNVHMDDMCRGVHEHLMFGDGEIDFAFVFDALADVGYAGPLHVELPRHSHNAVEAARQSHEFLSRLVRLHTHANA